MLNIKATTEVSTKEPINSKLKMEQIFIDFLSEEYKKITLDSCNELPTELVKLALDSIDGESIKSLFFYGEWGSGKSTLVIALTRYLMRKFCPHRYFWPNFVSGRQLDSALLKAVKSEEGDSYEISKWVESDLVIIDDLDKINPTERFKNQFFEIINGRKIKNLPTFITSNVTPNELSGLLDGSVVSRMSDQNKWVRIGFPKKDLRRSNETNF